jgi:uncharacterized protein (DUF2147 family)
MLLLAAVPLLAQAADPASSTTSASAGSSNNSPVGVWRTIDDSSGKPRALVKIIDVNGELRGSIAKLYQEPDEDQDPHCEKCSGERKNAPVLGMTILYGLHKDDEGGWSGGVILDPNNGDTYHSKLSVAPDGKTLTMRGYIGMSLFGRSQTWQRVE